MRSPNSRDRGALGAAKELVMPLPPCYPPVLSRISAGCPIPPALAIHSSRRAVMLAPAIHHVCLSCRQRCDQRMEIARIVFEVGVLDNHELPGKRAHGRTLCCTETCFN